MRILAASFSIAILAISLFVSGERYGEKADEFKACYLKLQRIYQSESSIAEKMTQYADVLDIYENQSDADYDEMLFDAMLRGQKLTNALGPVSISFVAGCRVLIKRSIRLSASFLVFLMPIIFGIMWTRQA